MSDVIGMLITNDRQAAPKRRGRNASSKISNGALFVRGVDQRSTWVRRGRDVEQALLSELGGADVVTAQEKLLVRKIAVLEVEMNLREERFAQTGSATDEQLAAYATTTNAQRRLLADIGIERRVAKDITPSLSSYVRQKVEHAIEAERDVDAEEDAS